MSAQQTVRFRGWLALLVTAWLAACNGAGGGASITPADAHKLVAAGATLLDVRSPAEWDTKHLEGAVLVPVAELETRLSEVPRDRPVVVYCASGGRSARATTALRAAGYDARDLGAMQRWYD